MAYTVSDGAVCEVTIVGRVFEQRCLTILHYQLILPSQGQTIDGNLAINQFNATLNTIGAGSLIGSYAACMAASYSFEAITYQWMYPTRYRRVNAPPAVVQGSTGLNCRQTNIAVAVNRFTENAGRGTTGTLHLPAVPDEWQAGGRLDGGLDEYNNFGTQSRTVSQLPNNVAMNPIIFSKGTPLFSKAVIGHIVGSELRTMRRRTVGRGV